LAPWGGSYSGCQVSRATRWHRPPAEQPGSSSRAAAAVEHALSPSIIARLPAQLLAAFQGRGLPAPSRRPTMSASPSPPHISEAITIPAPTTNAPGQSARHQSGMPCARLGRRSGRRARPAAQATGPLELQSRLPLRRRRPRSPGAPCPAPRPPRGRPGRPPTPTDWRRPPVGSGHCHQHGGVVERPVQQLRGRPRPAHGGYNPLVPHGAAADQQQPARAHAGGSAGARWRGGGVVAVWWRALGGVVAVWWRCGGSVVAGATWCGSGGVVAVVRGGLPWNASSITRQTVHIFE
jgi:hypothetical protein